MKTKLFTLFIVTCTLLIAFTACDNGNGKNDPPTFTVTFHANGGTPEPPPQTIAQGGKAAEPQVTKPNNTLDGWYTQAAFTAQWNFAADTVTAAIDLYAKWTEQPIQKTATLTLGQATVIIEYTALPSDAEPAYIARFQNRFASISNPEGGFGVFLGSLGTKTYTIQIVDGNGDFQMVDATTLKVGKDSGLETIGGQKIINGFKLLPGIVG